MKINTTPLAFTRRTLLKAGGAGIGALLLNACSSPTEPKTAATAGGTSLLGFEQFAATVSVVARDGLWLVESTGIPAHEMMTGIKSWQQQVPVPQKYTGVNAWRFPVVPVLAEKPVSAKTSLYRGAIALAVNGVPIFNALNNRGEDAFLAGELDTWGGHAGKADDYHYHVAPLHLQEAVGAGKPIAYALDGYPILGTTEVDGSTVSGLDELNGHDLGTGYHYHGTTTYPYINGGLRGAVSVSGDQVDPQPTTKPFRPDGAPLRGATITAFESPKTGNYRLTYSENGADTLVEYVVKDSSVGFTFTAANGTVRTETYVR